MLHSTEKKYNIYKIIINKNHGQIVGLTLLHYFTLSNARQFYLSRVNLLSGSTHLLTSKVNYTHKNYELLKTGLNNVVLPILLIVVNNIEQVVEPESSPQSGVTMLNNIVDIIEQCGQHNIVQSCFQQPVTTYNFWLCSVRE